MKRKLVLFLILILLSFNFISAIDLYVNQNNPSCNDALTRLQNTISTPWCTIARANNQHVGGDTVYIMPGEYRETIDPKSGLGINDYTVYSGYGNRSQVKIIGSNQVTGWTQCTSGCASTNVYYASFPADQLRCKLYDADIGGCTGMCNVLTTDCWEDGQRWYIPADLDESCGCYRASRGIGSVNGPGKYFYDFNAQRVYIWTFDSQSPQTHVIDCSRRQATANIYSSYLTIQNLTITQSLWGVRMGQPTQNISILNNEVSYTSGSGSCAQNPAAIYHGAGLYGQGVPYAINMNIIGNKIHDSGNDRGPPTTQCSHRGAGIEAYSLQGGIIANNEIYNVPEGITPKQGNNNTIIKNNTIHDFWCSGIYFITENNGISIEDNAFYDSHFDGNGIQIEGSNEFNTKVFHNIFYNLVGSAFILNANSNPLYTTNVKNNVFLNSNREILVTGATDDLNNSNYNLFFDIASAPSFSHKGSTFNFQQWQTNTGNDLNSIEANPLFVNAANRDFRLQDTSPAINHGTFIPGYHCPVNDETNPNQQNCKHWSGTFPDIGAFEYTGFTGNPPLVDNVLCEVNSNWVNCNTIAYGNNLTSVRAHCTDSDGTVTNANFQLTNTNDNSILLQGAGVLGSGDIWAYNNPDITITDSGNFVLTATCTDNSSTTGVGTVNWLIPWGILSSVHNSPINNFVISNLSSFAYNTTLTCIGGECGNVTATLDPIFGNNAIGASHGISGSEANGVVRCGIFQLNEPGTAKNITAYFRPINNSIPCAAAIYNSTSTTPNILRASSSQISTSNTPSWKTFPISDTVLEPGYYTLCITCNVGIDFYFTNPGTTSMIGIETTQYPFSDPFGPLTGPLSWPLRNWEMSIYAGYDTGPPPNPTKSVVPMNSGAPFYTTSQNPATCSNMKAGNTCTTIWNVIANGQNDTFTFYTIYTPTYSGVSGIQSQNINITITSGCPEPYNSLPCNCLNSGELTQTINAWYNGIITINQVITNIGLWRQNSSC